MAVHRSEIREFTPGLNSSSIDFTVAIPTYNGEQRLSEVLDRLRSQVDTDLISWEILVIDNNSRDKTAQVVQAYQTDFLAPFITI